MRYKRKKEKNMGAVLSLQQHIDKKEDIIRSYSVIDMIRDPEYRKKTFEYYDNNYQETNEENEIFKSWQKRRTKKGD